MSGFSAKANELLVEIYRNVQILEQNELKKQRLNISINEMHMIELIAKGKTGMTVSEIAQQLKVTKPSVTVAVNKLGQKGYCEKQRLPGDGRAVQVMPVSYTHLDVYKRQGAVGTVLFFSTIVELPVILFSYKFMDRFSGRTLMLLAFAIMVAQFLLYATAPNAFVAVVTMLVLRAVGSTLFGMILLKIVRGVVQVRSVSTALGVISATDAMSAILMQNLGGILVENTSIRILYFAMAGLMMLGMILTLFLRVQNTEKVFS